MRAPDAIRASARGAYTDREACGTREAFDAAADVAYAAGRAAAAADIRAQADSTAVIEGGPDLMNWAAEIAEGTAQ